MDRQVAINPRAQGRRRKARKFFSVVFVVLLLVGVGAGVYVWQQQEMKKLKQTHSEEIDVLHTTIEALKQEIGSAQSSNGSSEATNESYGALKEIIEKAVKGQTYIELSTHMTNPVNITLAASEGLGARTPAQALEDIKFLNSARGEWSFDIPAVTLTQWRGGSYAQYVPENAVIGVSSDGYVVIFKLNTENKITDIFMSPDRGLMTP